MSSDQHFVGLLNTRSTDRAEYTVKRVRFSTGALVAERNAGVGGREDDRPPPCSMANCKNRRIRSQHESKLKTAQHNIKSYNGGRPRVESPVSSTTIGHGAGRCHSRARSSSSFSSGAELLHLSLLAVVAKAGLTVLRALLDKPYSSSFSILSAADSAGERKFASFI